MCLMLFGPGQPACAASVTGWYGLHFANRPCPPRIFYACQLNAVMTACVASLPNKTQISPMIKVTHTLLNRSRPLISLREEAEGGWPLWPQSVLMFSLFSPFSAAQVLSASLQLLVTGRGQYSNQSFPLRRSDLLLAFICVSVKRLRLLHGKFIPGSQGSAGLTGHLLSVSQELRLLGLLYSEIWWKCVGLIWL